MAVEESRPKDDHFFLAAQRWIHRNDVTSVLLTCHRETAVPFGDKRRPALQVPGCLQELPLHRLVDLYLAGASDVAVGVGPGCTEEDLRTVLESWNAMLGEHMSFSVLDPTPARNWTWSLSPTRVPVDRRGLLGLGRQSSPPWPVHDASSDDQMRLVESLRAAQMTSMEQPPAGLSLLASGCTACGVCVSVCPHDALSLIPDGSEYSLLHAPDACHGEQQCVALCPVSALSVDGPLPWAEVIHGTPRVLATLEMAVCERCQAPFPATAESQWCEPCRIRRSDPFGSHLPAAALELLRARGHTPRA